MPRVKFTPHGRIYYTLDGAAKLLRTNIFKVKQLMSDGVLEWSNLRVNGPVYISRASILAYQRRGNVPCAEQGHERHTMAPAISVSLVVD